MKTLKEIINKYEIFGLTDFQIIQKYFIENQLEAQAVLLLTELLQKQINGLHAKNYLFKDNLSFCKVVFANIELSPEDRIIMFNLISKFTYERDLNEDELKEIKRIFDTGKVIACPVYFSAYLKKNDIIKGKDDLCDYDLNSLETVLNIRGEN